MGAIAKEHKKFCNFFAAVPIFFPTMAKGALRWMYWTPEEKPMGKPLEH